MRLFYLVFISTLGFAASVMAQAPLSAIDWLSDSINDPPVFEIPTDTAPLVEPFIQDISVKKGLTPVSPDAIGLLSPALTGFSAGLWGDMLADDIANLITNFPNEGMPEARSVFRRILLAQANPAPNDIQNGLVLQARAGRLLDIGALDAAEALIGLAPATNPSIFEQKFNISVLTNRTSEVCDALKTAPAISDDLSARIFCLARGGDWNAAAITLSLGAGIGAIEPARAEMLMRFLDPELFEGEPDPAAPNPMNIMDFVLREAVLLPRPTGLMPLPYLYRDIGTRAPLRAKLDASERLVMAGSLPSNLLFAAYREGKAASSGGVWGRANSVQLLDDALKEKNIENLSRALLNIYEEFSSAGLLNALAEEYAEVLSTLEYSPEFNGAALPVLDLLHLANVSNSSWADGVELDENRRLALAIVTQAPLIIDPSGSAMQQSIINGLNGPLPNNPATVRLLGLLEEDRQGQAILASLGLLSDGSMSDPEGVRTGLYVLVAAGQTAAARRIAVQILLLPVGG
ncbi:hypothetical protein A9Q96_12045 [Rhodobacterales bacterium 52_120_T64]|nr:hypothetical protein A9Q96_12045 [Rhodobacterales bacterium 52_120_T64]